MKYVKGIWVGQGETWKETRDRMEKWIVTQLSAQYPEQSRTANLVKKGLTKMTGEELNALNKMVYTSRKGGA